MAMHKMEMVRSRRSWTLSRLAAIAILPVLATATSNTPATAADADADRGFDLAARWCNGCHSIGDDPQRQEDAGTPFAELAEKDVLYLQSAINHPHEFMPDFPQLTDADKADLVAYIRFLGG